MAKLNLKTAHPINTGESPPKTGPAEQKISTDNFTEEIDELTLSAEPEEMPESQESVPAPREQVETEEELPETPQKELKAKPFEEQSVLTDIEEEDTTGEYGEDYDYFAPKPKKKLFIFLVILLLIVAVSAYGIFQYRENILSVLPFFKDSTQGQAEMADQPEQATRSIPQPVLNLIRDNLAINQIIVGKFQGILTSEPGFIRFSIIVLSPSEINMTAIADSRSKISQYNTAVNQSMPDLNFKTISTQSKMLNNREFIFADLTAKINLSAATSSQVGISRVNEKPNFESELRNLLELHKVGVDYLNKGREIEHTHYSENLYYLNISGSQDRILNFLSKMAPNYTLLRINKLSVNPTNFTTFSDQNLSARINLSYYHPK